ncbi:hypothetical protein KFK09_010052 [Dendrobium nobile]|uniref:Uncharacterized protein n=1 Tax=Dendrobium nobile TaxID=94219 RepID=A0A8T3BMT5_DENNO|nr:hypothetical protein KFK09_010052 [Dendrobium nobile]
MSSFIALRPLSPALSSSSITPFISPPLCSVPCLPLFSVSFPLLRRSSCSLRALCVQDPGSVASDGETKPPNGNLPKSRREILLEYIKNVQPDFLQLFMKRAPQQIVDAMRQTVTNMIGTLPPQFFAVTVTTDAPDYAPGSQKKVTGEVIRWNKVSGPEKMDAVKYIEYLEAEIEELNEQVKRRSANGHNELLEYLKTLEPQNLKELTSSAGEDVVFAMNTFIKRLLAVSDPAKMKTAVTETSAPELANLLYWLMVVGYSIRNIEVRFDMEKVLGAPPKLAELPPGENI